MKTIISTVDYAEDGCYIQSVKLEISDEVLKNIEKAKIVIESNPEFQAIEILATGSIKEVYSEDANDLIDGEDPEVDTMSGPLDCERISVSSYGTSFSCCYKYSGGDAFYTELDI